MVEFNKALMFHNLQHGDAVLIYASHKRFGGGFKNHSRAQEEWIFNNSDLPSRTPPSNFYPLAHGEVSGFIMPAVTNTGVRFNAVFVPAPVWSLYTNPNDILRARAELVFELGIKAAKSGTFVIGPWGCGVFGCPIMEVAKLFKELAPSSLNYRINTPSTPELDAFKLAFK